MENRIGIRFVKQWDITPDPKPFRADLYCSDDRSKCPRCLAPAYFTKGGLWHCDPCALSWLPSERGPGDVPAFGVYSGQGDEA